MFVFDYHFENFFLPIHVSPTKGILNFFATMEIDSKGFRINFWNARSLPNKIEQFRILLDEHKPQIFCINETWLKHNYESQII